MFVCSVAQALTQPSPRGRGPSKTIDLIRQLYDRPVKGKKELTATYLKRGALPSARLKTIPPNPTAQT